MPSPVTKTSPTSSSDTGKKRLLTFLRELLADEKMRDIIVWVDEDQQIFKMIKPHAVADKWGLATHNLAMSYDKMSRGLRYLYKSNTLKKCSGKDSKYQFLERASSTPSPTSSTSNSPPQPRQPIQLVANVPIVFPAFPVLQFPLVPLVPMVTPSVPGTSTQIDASSSSFNIERFLSGLGSNTKNPNNSLHSSPSSSSSNSSNTSNEPSSPTTSSEGSNAPSTSTGVPLFDVNKFLFNFYLNNPHLLPKQQ